jgi:hypothetical protein
LRCRKIEKSPDFEWLETTTQIKDVDGLGGWLEGFEQNRQLPRSDRLGDINGEEPDYSCSRTGRIESWTCFGKVESSP